jgi:hypothetical protein
MDTQQQQRISTSEIPEARRGKYTGRRDLITALLGLAILLGLTLGAGSATRRTVAAPPGPGAVRQPAAGATFDVTWAAGCETPPAEAVTAFDYAVDLFSGWISSTVPIEVSVCWTAALSCGEALGCGAPTAYVRNFAGAPMVATYYPVALANALHGADLTPSGGDIGLQFKSTVGWSYATTTPGGGEDFVSVALHELAHGLGFIGYMVAEYNVGFCGTGTAGARYPYCPTPYDRLAVDSAGTYLLDYLTPDPRELGKRLMGSTADANAGGPNARLANGGSPARLYTPINFVWGTSFSHLDTAFQYTDSRLMTPYSSATRTPGPVTLGILQDMGWPRAEAANLTTAGPLVVGVGNTTTFTGTLAWPGYAGQPLTYTWTTDLSPVTHAGTGATDVVEMSWSDPGIEMLQVTATGSGVDVGAARALLVFDVLASGPTQGDTGQSYTFNAALTPSSGGYPVTFTWQATDQDPVSHTGATAGDSVAFTWSTPGTKTITVAATVDGETVQTTHVIGIGGPALSEFVFLPLITSP